MEGVPQKKLKTDKVVASGDWGNGVHEAGVLHCMPLDEFVSFIHVYGRSPLLLCTLQINSSPYFFFFEEAPCFPSSEFFSNSSDMLWHVGFCKNYTVSDLLLSKHWHGLKPGNATIELTGCVSWTNLNPWTLKQFILVVAMLPGS